jgi:CDP-diacylglycerol pyrophosphatase
VVAVVDVVVVVVVVVAAGLRAIPTSAQSVALLRLIGKFVGEDTPEVDHSAPCTSVVPELSEES